MRYVIVRIVVLTVVLVLLVGAVGYRCLTVAPYPTGGGQYLASPNGKHEAYASEMYDEDFWGYSRSYYEFEIRDKASRAAIKKVRMDKLLGKPPFPMRSDQRIISWSADSSSATYKFQGIELRLEAKP